MHEQLLSAYGRQNWWPAETPFEVILGAYLTQNTSWLAVEKTLMNLRAAGVFDLDALRQVSLRRLQQLVRPSGFYTRKASALKAFVSFLDTEAGGSLSTLAGLPTLQLRSLLLDLPGVGRETADAILLYALGHKVPVADEYLRRIVSRHHLLDPHPGHDRRSYEAMAELTRKAFSTDPDEEQAALFNEFHALVVEVGKRHCGRVASCARCPLAGDLLHANPKQAIRWKG